ncbi:metal ABC transporter solute-binding protein, Zn/Mn family [Micromonospora sp. NBC_01813]|uniref:metal ABC transporter solute-binding protein, Zn/Mn family n=1 Tax=Micromonospora sp. NBC_01813 TaxID=2975988 RepID=UPI002DD98419|nr:zinc ABC transporter substrate-binding protein [Micromonospora sp. NBC_01813]WSA10763.1 zinc ABC transporter substrate-binding protein [Micromonospora sp. NBC_01813]
MLSVLLLAVSTTGCGSTEDGPAADGSSTAGAGLKVVASTSWVGALAKAAGAAEVTVIAPANVQHPPDYEPKPSDLASVGEADYVLYSEFDGFATKINEAVGGTGTLVAVELENTPAKIRSEVTRLGEMFGTEAAAANWLTNFDTEYQSLSEQVKAEVPNPAPVTVTQLFMAYWADFAGLSVAATYGPAPITPAELSELVAQKPTLVLANYHMSGMGPDLVGAKRAELINFPGDDLDLLEVFRTNAERISAALAE